MSDLPARPETPGRVEPREPDELLIEAIDEQALRQARERMAARVRRLWEARGLLVRIGLWGLALATAVAFLIPKRYEVKARLMPPDASSAGALAGAAAAVLGQTAGPLAGLASSALGIKSTGALFVGILQSQTVQDAVIRKFDLQRVYHVRYLEDARKELAAHTDVSEDVKSGIVTLTVTDRDPHRAAAMAEEYISQLNWVVSHLSTSAARRERIFLEQRLQQVRQELESAERQFSQFSSEKGAIDIQTQGRAMVEAAARLQGELIATQAQLEALRQIYTDNNVRVRALEAQAARLRQELVRMAGKGAGETSTASELYPPLRQLPLLGVTYADLLRQVRVQEAVYETLTKEYELAKVEEAREIPTVKVLDQPVVPSKKSFPPRLLIIVLGTLLAGLLGVSWVLGQAAWEATDPTDPRKQVALAIWGDIRQGMAWTANGGARAALLRLRGKFRRPER